MLRNKTVLREALYNTAPDAKSNPAYARGIVVGAIAAIMATGRGFDDALTLVRLCLPYATRPECLPPFEV
jgi:hypothetical protein